MFSMTWALSFSKQSVLSCFARRLSNDHADEARALHNPDALVSIARNLGDDPERRRV